MGWFDGASDVGGRTSRSSHRKSSSSHLRSHSTGGAWVRRPSPSRHHSTGSVFGLGGGSRRPSPSRHHSSGSVFGLGSSHHNASTRSFFSFGGGKHHRRASPRSGYFKRMYAQLRRLLRDLIYYMKRHPIKVFVLVIMPLLTGGALSGLLRQFGIRLPAGLEKMFGGSGTSLGRDHRGNMQWERSRYESDSPLGGLGGFGGLAGGAGSLMTMAKLFM